MANYFVQQKGRLKLNISERGNIINDSKGQRMNKWRVLIHFNSGGNISRTDLHSGGLKNAFMDIAEVAMPHDVSVHSTLTCFAPRIMFPTQKYQ